MNKLAWFWLAMAVFSISFWWAVARLAMWVAA
jgi:hypothetical protein